MLVESTSDTQMTKIAKTSYIISKYFKFDGFAQQECTIRVQTRQQLMIWLNTLNDSHESSKDWWYTHKNTTKTETMVILLRDIVYIYMTTCLPNNRFRTREARLT